ncbi:MAG: hypothetical protein P1P82_17640 [Bacteroidales bacterium]|nr:hypothetical protein [Bacteroidales bacterium]
MHLAAFNKVFLVPIVALLVFAIPTGNAQSVSGKTVNQKEDKGDLPKPWVHPPPDQHAAFPVSPFVPGKCAPLVFMGAEGRLVYKPYSDKGDRVLDWSQCGYEKSEVPIPDVPVAEILQPLSQEDGPSGKMRYPQGSDQRELIQAALDRTAALEPMESGFRGAVLLKKGTYYINGSLEVASGVVLRGEGDGADGTVLIYTTNGGGNAVVVEGEGPVTKEETTNKVRIAQDYLPSGSIALEVEDAGLFQPGDVVCIKKTVNEKWIEDLGVGERLRHIRAGEEGSRKSPWKPGSYQFEHIRRIMSVNGNTVTLDMVLPQSLDKQHGGGEVYRVNVDQLGAQSGVEFLRVVSNYDTTVTSVKKKTNYSNFGTGISLRNTSNSWVRNCTMLHFYKSAVSIEDHTQNITVRDCKSLQPVGPFGGGYRYPFAVNGGTGHLFFHCYSEDARHDFVGGSRTMGPFAFVQCTAVRGGASEPHHRWGTGYLFDCITTDGSIGAFNRGDSGSGHGWAAANTMIWNADAHSVTVFDPETTGENNFAIGFTGEYSKETFDPMELWYANTRAGYWGTPREGKYYGFALMGNGHIECPDKPAAPASLFVQQLIDRIGSEQAMKVLQ